MQCVILAGGLGTRMRPHTETLPKFLIPVLGQPFAHHQLSYLAKQGVRHVVLCIGYKGDQIRDYVQSGRNWGLKVSYVDEGQDLKGTAGALRLALDQNTLNPAFLVMYGDSYLPVQYLPIFSAFANGENSALMTVFKNTDQFDQSNVCVTGRQVSLYDKWVKDKPREMKFIDYGLSIFRRETIENLVPRGQKLDLSNLFHDLSQSNQLGAYEVHQRFYEIGSPSGLQDLEQFLHSQSVLPQS